MKRSEGKGKKGVAAHTLWSQETLEGVFFFFLVVVYEGKDVG